MSTAASTPVRDKEIIDFELQIKDLETIDTRLAKTIKGAQVGADKSAKMQVEVLQRIKAALEKGLPARSVTFDNPDEQRFVHDLFPAHLQARALCMQRRRRCRRIGQRLR